MTPAPMPAAPTPRLARLATLRPPGAARRLRALVQARHAQPFAWGVRDCCLWAADAVLAVTGQDPAAGLRGTYASARQAVRIVRQGGGLQHLVGSRLAGRIDVADAIDGDVCLLAPHAAEVIPGLGALGVLWHGAVLAQAGTGLAPRPVEDAVCWWGVEGAVA